MGSVVVLVVFGMIRLIEYYIVHTAFSALINYICFPLEMDGDGTSKRVDVERGDKNARSAPFSGICEFKLYIIYSRI